MAQTGNRQLTDDQVREIRRRARTGDPARVIAAAYGLTTTPIYHLLRGATYADVPDGKDKHPSPGKRAWWSHLEATTVYPAYWQRRAGATYRQLAERFDVSAMGIRGAVLRIPATGAGAVFPDIPPEGYNDTGPIHGTPRGRLAHEHDGTEPCTPCTQAWDQFARQCETDRQTEDHQRREDHARKLVRNRERERAKRIAAGTHIPTATETNHQTPRRDYPHGNRQD